MYLPAKLLTFINDLPKDSVPIEALFGCLLARGEETSEEELQAIDKDKLISIAASLGKYPPAVLSRYEKAFKEDYLADTFKEYAYQLDPKNAKDGDLDNLKELADFHRYYNDQIQIQELGMVKYFDTLLTDGESTTPAEDKESKGERLEYKVVPKDEKGTPSGLELSLSLVSQRDSLVRLKKLSYLATGAAARHFFVSNALDYALKVTGELTAKELENLLKEDIAILNGKGYLSKRTSQKVTNFLMTNFDKLSASFF